MRNQVRNPRAVVITHAVNPHQFYFKYLDECMNSEYTKFDIEIQAYALELRVDISYQEGYLPVENELVILFHIIFNKWVRARVICIDEEIALWCIDNGVIAKCTKHVILPLATRFHEESKLVHLGGLSVVPTEKTFNNDTAEIEIKQCEKWDKEMIITLKAIVSNSKTITFTEEFELSGHRFGSLTIQSKSGKIIVINNTLVEMNKSGHISADSEEDLSNYVTKDRLEYQLYQSQNDDPKKKYCKKMNLSRRFSNSSIKTEREMSSICNLAASELYEDSASSSNDSQILENSITPRSGVPTLASNLDNLSKTARSLGVGTAASESSEKLDDSASMSSISTLTSENISSSSSQSHRNESRTSNVCNFENDYECNLRSCSTVRPGKLRPPLQTSMNWIYTMSKSTSMNTISKDKKSLGSSIMSSNEIESTPQTSPLPSSSSNRSPRSRNLNNCNNNGTTSFNDFNSNNSNNSVENNKIVNNLDRRQKNFGVPGGFAKNCLDSFGGLTKRN